MKLKSKIIAITLTLTTLMSATAMAANTEGSTASMRASENLSTASGVIVAGTGSLLVASGELLVVGIEQTGKGV